MALLSTLTDTFDGATLDTSKWSDASSNSAPPTVGGGTLSLSTAAIPNSRCSVKSATLYTVKNSYLFAKIVVPDNSITNGVRTSLGAYYDAINRCLGEMRVSSGTLLGAYYSAGDKTATLGTYDPVSMAYWRITFAATQVTFATSPDGATWTDRGTYTASLYDGDVTSVRIAVDTLSISNAASTAQIDNINTIPVAAVTIAPDGINDTDTVGAPTTAAALGATPGSIIDVDTVTGPAAFYATPVNPGSTSDPDSVGQPTLTFTDTPPAYGLGAYGIGLYGVGVPDPGPIVVPDEPPPAANYGYGAGIYGDGPYVGSNQQTDNPTYGSGTYGYGPYYGQTTAKPATPLFNDFAGTNRPVLHILGIGPWSPAIRWRGATNYGIPAGNRPSRPALPLPPATSKGFTLRLNDGGEARAELNLPRGSGLVIDEMDTDLWWRRKDPRTGLVEVIGRFNTSHVNLQTSDTGLSLSVQFDDYRTVLANRRIMRYMHPTWDKGTQTQWGQGTPVTDVFKWAIPANTRLDLSELDNYDLGNLTGPYYLPPGTPLSEVFESVEALSHIDWEWWIETPNDINAAPKLRFILGTRGSDKGVILHDLGKGPSPIASWTRNTAADNYANSLMYNGGVDKNGIGGSIVKTIPAQIIQYGQRDTVDGNSSLAGDKKLIDARAAKKLAKLASRDATWTIRLAPGFWRGRNHIDIGDTVRLVVRLGKETINEKHRVTEIDVAIDDNNLEDVTLTVGPPLPSPDPRSKRSPLQRIVRYLRDYTPPEGSSDVVTEDE